VEGTIQVSKCIYWVSGRSDDAGMREQTDGQLVKRVREGDLSAFEAMVDRHRGALVALAAARLGSLADAEDVAQDAFVRAFFRLRQLRNPDAVLPWLRRLTDRLALMRLRSRREEPVEPDRLEAMHAPAHADSHRETKELLQRLPEAMRQTIALTYLAGYTCAETASLLGVREGTVKSRLSRARAIMRKVIGMTEEDLKAGKPTKEFTQQTIERLMRDARRLLEEGDLEDAAQRADEVLGIQV
jgi:RNA polymerase sigma-70 factor (ECF subfamily)